jgi:hypothetical protein
MSGAGDDDAELPPLDLGDDGDQGDAAGPDPAPRASTARPRRAAAKRRTSTRKTRSDAGVPRGSRSAAPPAGAAGSNAKLARELLNPIAKFAKGLAFVAPTVSAVLLDRGESTARALVGIAANHPRMLAALRSTTQVGDGAELLETALAAGIALALDFGRMPPTHPLAVLTGTAALYHQIHPEHAPDSAPYAGNGHPPGPPPMTMPTDPRHPMYSFTAPPGAGARAAGHP